MSEFPTAPVPQTVSVDAATLTETDRLAILYAAYPSAKAARDEAEANLKAITDGIKLELTQRAPEGTRDLEIKGAGGTPLRLDWRVSHRFDSKAFCKASPEHAALYESFKKPSGSWTLSPIKGGE